MDLGEVIGRGVGEYIELVNQLLIDKKINVDYQEYLEEYPSEEKLKLVKDTQVFLEKEAKSLQNTFDSVIPNEMIIDGMENCLWIALICISIILANTFGIEKQYDMEQLIYPTKASPFNITIAKITAGTIVSFVTMLCTLLSCFLVSYILLPVHTWDVAIIGEVGIRSVYSYQDVLVSLLKLSLMCSLATACISLLLSYITKNKFVVIVIMFLYFGSIIFLDIQGYFKMMHPYNMLHISQYFYNMNAYTRLGGEIVPYRDIVFIIWAVIVTIAFCSMIIRSKMQSARTIL